MKIDTRGGRVKKEEVVHKIYTFFSSMLFPIIIFWKIGR